MNRHFHGTVPLAAEVGAFAFEGASRLRSELHFRRLPLFYIRLHAKVVEEQAVGNILGLDNHDDFFAFFHGDLIWLELEPAGGDRNGLRRLRVAGESGEKERDRERKCCGDGFQNHGVTFP